MQSRATATIKGVAPLMMHNGQLADPMNKYAIAIKKISSKRNKTDEDYIEIAHLEFLGGMYYDKTIGVYIPVENIDAMVRDAAKLKKLGTSVQRGVQCDGFILPLEYVGPRDPEVMWDTTEFRDVRGIKNGASGGRVMRCRPLFREWSLTFTLTYEKTQINEENLRQCVEDAGKYIGLGDYRPGSPKGGRFGRFDIVKWS